MMTGCSSSFPVVCLILLFSALGSQPLLADTPKKKTRKTGTNIAYYFDSRDFNTITIVNSTSDLPLGFAVWGFADFLSAPKDADERFDITRYFIEYRLLRPIEPAWVKGLHGLGAVIEYNDLEGGDNALVRLGISYKRFLPFTGSWLQGRVFPVETDGNGAQFALSYRLNLNPSLYLGGFVDYNWIEGGENRWVTEPQLTYRIGDRYALLLEFRYNEFERDDKGLSAGFEVVF